jgi:hypothetical protein
MNEETKIGNKIRVKIFNISGDRVYFCDKTVAVQVFTETNNPIVLLDNVSEKDLKKIIGKCEYQFRKGVGYKGEIFRLKFKEIRGSNVIFFKFRKENRKLKINKNDTLKLDLKELKYIYPLVLSPDLTDNGFQWSENYIIFPYEYGEKQPVNSFKLSQEAPHIYNYFSSHFNEIVQQSTYNRRIQNVKEFYGLIRVGKYSYSKFFVAIRDNTKLNACAIKWIKTHWGEYKNPVFDNHVSYVPVSSMEEANYVVSKLRDPTVEKLVQKIFDTRSIGSRLPFKIPKYKIKP